MSNARSFLRYARIMQDRRQDLMADTGALSELPNRLLEDGIKRIYFISGKQTKKLKLYDAFLEDLESKGIRCFTCDKVDASTDGRIIETCATECRNYNCEAIVAFGGGTVIDIAKLVSAWVANAERSLYQMRGIGKIPNPGVDLHVISTTGSGAESSACSFVRYDQQTCLFYSEHLIPKSVVLDPDLLLRLPMDNLAAAGLFALTHAIEAYVSLQAEEFPADKANVMVAVPIFFSYLEKCYRRGGVSNDMYLQLMMASYYSGIATRRIGFGYAHCFAMRISEKYDIMPGHACAAVLPEILRYEFDKISKPLSELAKAAHLCSARASEEQAALALIEGVESLCRRVQLPASLTCLKSEDFNGIIEMVQLDSKQWGCPKRITAKTAVDLMRNFKLRD
ncbi:MAG: iron-containing alcohol dehydrogenase [Clostridiales bacterium]|nr:iron-containing alcohol dehydrogenase [Clostridiales bacterium]